MPVAELDLELDVFAGPFDLLMAVVLREGVNLAEVELGEVVVAYVEHLEETGDLDLESATEFLVLIAALLELKSRLLLPAEESEEEMPAPEEAAEELLARMLEYRRYHDAAGHFQELFEAGRDLLFRSRAAAARASPRLAGGGSSRLLEGSPGRRDRRSPAHAGGARHLTHPPDRLPASAASASSVTSCGGARRSTSTSCSAARTA